MNIFNKIFKLSSPNGGHDSHLDNQITAKEKQSILIKLYLKPTLRQLGFLTDAQTWWRDQGDFFLIINLQNFSWNTKIDVAFCFNIGIAVKSAMRGTLKRPSHFDLTVQVRENVYLSNLRSTNSHRYNNGYIINQNTDITAFIEEIKIDFETEILPSLDKLKSIEDCVKHYEKFPFYGEQLKRILNIQSD